MHQLNLVRNIQYYETYATIRLVITLSLPRVSVMYSTQYSRIHEYSEDTKTRSASHSIYSYVRTKKYRIFGDLLSPTARHNGFSTWGVVKPGGGPAEGPAASGHPPVRLQERHVRRVRLRRRLRVKAVQARAAARPTLLSL